MEDLIETLTNDHVTEVKIVLTSIATVLAVYQVVLMAVGYGKLRVRFLSPRAASVTHRSVGDTIVPVTVFVGLACLSYFGIEDGIDHARNGQEAIVTLHVVSSFALAVALALKIIVVRWWHSMGRYLPWLGTSVFALFVLTWVTTAGAYL
jgi:Family of unknown function (DUF6529)